MFGDPCGSGMPQDAPPRGVLRHGRALLWPSTIAGQWYCELKTHLEHAHPELLVDAAALDDGTEGHGALAGAGVPATPVEIAAAVAAGEEVQAFEWLLEGAHGGVPIRGKPDLVDAAGGAARLVYEFKFSRSDRVWPSQHVQARVYGRLLELAGLDVRDLVTVIVLFPPLPRDLADDPLRAREAAVARLADAGTLDDVERLARHGRDEILRHGHEELTLRRQDFRLGLARYDPRLAQANLDWALAYWRGEREPVANAGIPGKCRACPVNAAGLCADALAPASGDFEVRREPEGIRVRRA